ncbi:MAG: hypothetical protein QW828_03575 [Candidatus Bathyarchaeia archaeon]
MNSCRFYRRTLVVFLLGLVVTFVVIHVCFPATITGNIVLAVVFGVVAYWIYYLLGLRLPWRHITIIFLTHVTASAFLLNYFSTQLLVPSVTIALAASSVLYLRITYEFMRRKYS